MFQNNKGEIFGCGYNIFGQVGLGNFETPQIKVSPILNAPKNIVHFCCGYNQSFFLDNEGKVFSVGYNVEGNLGLGNNSNQNTLAKITNIPPIQSISSAGYSCYLLDYEGNVRSFGYNSNGELGHGDTAHKNTPKQIKSLKNIRQISYGSFGHHFLAKDSQNKIFVAGRNNYGQLGTGDTQPCSIPKEIQYCHIWRNERIINEWRYILSATLQMNWKEEEIETST